MGIFENLGDLNFVDDENEISIDELENEESQNAENKENGDKPNSGDNSTNEQSSSLDDEELKTELEEFEIDENSLEGLEEDNIESETDNNNSSSDESFSPVTSLASSLFEEGVLASLTKEEVEKIKSGEDLIEAIKKQVKENEFADLTEEEKDYLDAIRKGVPLEEYIKSKETYSSYESIEDEDLESEENKNLRFQLIKNSFLLKGIDEVKAEKLTKRAFDIGEDVEDAKTALDELKKYEKDNIENLKKEKQAEREKLIKQQAEEFNTIRNLVNTTEEVIPGFKIDENSKKAVERLITKPFTKDKNGNQVNEVIGKMIEDKNYFVKLHYIHHLTEGFTKFDKFVNKAKTQAVKTLEEKLKLQDTRINSSKQNIPSKANDGLFKVLDKINY